MEQLATESPAVEVLAPSTRAGSAGRNFYRLIRDVDVGASDFVAFSDQDDIWYADKLVRACSALAGSGAAGYSSAVQAVYADGRRHILAQSPRVTPVDFIFEGAGQGCTFVLSRDLFLHVQHVVRTAWEEVGQVNHHDWLAYALCRGAGQHWYFDPIPSMDYRQHDSNELGGRGSVGGALRRWRMVKSGWYRHQVDAICVVMASVGLDQPLSGFLHRKASRAQPFGRVVWCCLLLTHGRRKLLDRLVLVSAAVCGFL
jgi:rhamnosyltransferase